MMLQLEVWKVTLAEESGCSVCHNYVLTCLTCQLQQRPHSHLTYSSSIDPSPKSICPQKYADSDHVTPIK